MHESINYKVLILIRILFFGIEKEIVFVKLLYILASTMIRELYFP